MRSYSNIKMKKPTGEILWELYNVEVPEEGKWSEQALKIAIDKYFTKENFEKHKSINYLIERTVESIIKDTYLENSYNERTYKEALIKALKRQDVVFNSPVWFNFYPENKKPVGSACFILGLEDDLGDILDKDRLEGVIYSEGSGAGLNYSKLRANGAPLSGGGKASGPLSFMYKNDATGAIIRSGGKLRRAAKMCVLNDNHPDIMDFVLIKKKEEDKAKALIEWDKQHGGKKGWGDGYLESEAYRTVAHQNANHSVGIHDDFMNSYLNDEMYKLVCPNTGEAVKEVKAKELMEEIAKSAWECGDPGLFFLDTVNSKNVFGEVTSSNPCLAGNTPVLIKENNELFVFKIRNLSGRTAYIRHINGFKTAKFFKTGAKQVFRVNLAGGHYIDVTSDHKWRTVDNGWVETKDLKGEKVIFHDDFILPSCDFKHKKAIIAGFLLGDGVYHKTNTSEAIDIKFSDKDRDVKKLIYDYLGKEDGFDQKHFSSVELLSLYRQYNLIEDVNINRRFPLTGSLDQIRSFLRGIYSANGSVIVGKGPRVTLKSVNRKLIQDVQKALSMLGLKSFVTVNKSHKQKFSNGEYIMKQSYDLNVSGKSVDYFAEHIGFIQKYKNEKLKKAISDYNPKFRRNRPIRVKNIVPVGTQDVYDFTILENNEEKSAIICGFELHNCGEFVFLDNSACNLGAIKVSNFVKEGKFDRELLTYAVNIMIKAMDIIVDKTNYPNEAIRENSVKYRPLGLGITDLAGALMKMGIPYNTKEGRKIVEELIEFIDNKAWEVSQRLAQRQGTEITKEQVVGMKKAGVIPQDIETVRNAQVTLMAPNGTTSFLVDASTTGIEPLAFLSQRKRMVGGSEFVWIPDCVKDGLEKLGYDSKKGLEFIKENGTLKGFIDDDDLDVFKTAQEITPMEHIEMMAVIQKHISGAISKTINLPNSVTVEEIQHYYVEAWKRGLKGITVYRSGSKSFEPLKSSKDSKKDIKTDQKTESIELTDDFSPLRGERRRMPDTRNSITHKFEVAGHQGYVTVGFFDDGKVGEMFIKMAKEGSTLSGFMDSMAMVMSIGLQYGIPLEVYTKKMKYSKFEPSGMTSNGDIPMVDSLVDYIARWLEFISEEKNREKDKKVFENSKNIEYDSVDKSLVDLADARVCSYCNAMMYRKGTCFYCENCGTSSGCS